MKGILCKEALEDFKKDNTITECELKQGFYYITYEEGK